MTGDPHVHLRDWKQKRSETLEHGLFVLYIAGNDFALEMPNTDPALISYDLIKRRLDRGSEAIKNLSIQFFHGLYGGLTDNPEQIKEVVKAYNDFGRVVGIKMFAGQSTGNMGLTEVDQQRIVYRTLAKVDYRGVLAVHCEKESHFKNLEFDPKNPITHAEIRDPMSEVRSIDDQINLAIEENFKGTLHIVHISVPESLALIEGYREQTLPFKITCGLTPHHALLNMDMMKSENGLLLKMNPPLRPKEMQEYMLQALYDNRIDWIETDHAPHTLTDKLTKYASGIPGLPFYPEFLKILKEGGMSEKQLADLTHNNIVNTFQINVLNSCVVPNNKYKQLVNEYQFDAFKVLK